MKFGIEEEFCLITLPDGRMDNSINDVLVTLPLPLRDGRMKPDLHECILEVSTGICTSYQQMHDEIRELRRTALRTAEKLGLGLISSGTHPISPWQEAVLVENPRYRRLISGGALLAEGVHFGMHVHYDVSNDQLRVKLVNLVRLFIPEVVAVSVNSPFHEGTFSGYKSSRLHRYDPTPTVGIPPALERWTDLERYIKKMAHLGIKEERDIYWDVRHRKGMRTLEFRVMDTQADLPATLAVASLILSILIWVDGLITSGADIPISLPTEEEAVANREEAKRYGLDAIFTIEGKEISAKKRIVELVDNVQNSEFSPGLSRIVDRVERGITGADQQLLQENPTGAINWLRTVFLEE